MPTLAYLGQAPAEGTGSPVVVMRHLRRCAAAGWRIVVVAEPGQSAPACAALGWPVLPLPHRRAWWPPFKAELAWSRRLRTALLARAARQALAPHQPNALLSYLAAHDDFVPEVAGRLAALTRLPLSLLVHDDPEAFPYATRQTPAERAARQKRHRWLHHRAHRVWFASPELAARSSLPASAQQVLWPIPAGDARPAEWHPARATPPRLVYAGHLWPAQLPLLGTLAHALAASGARLCLQTRLTPELQAWLKTYPAEHIPLFPTNEAALAHLAATATAVLVSYATETSAMPWSATSFPSKFIEYTHLGLPCAVLAPADTAIRRWAERAAYPHVFEPDAAQALATWTCQLTDPARWSAASALAAATARTHFDPAELQARFAADLRPKVV
jgi:hypothetical protein